MTVIDFKLLVEELCTIGDKFNEIYEAFKDQTLREDEEMEQKFFFGLGDCYDALETFIGAWEVENIKNR